MSSTSIVTAGGLVTVEGSGFPLLDTTIIQTLNRDDIMPDMKYYKGAMDFTETPILSINEAFAAKSAPKPMSNVLETGIAQEAEKIFTPKKGIYQQEIAQSYSRSKLFTAYAKNAKTLQGAPTGVEAELLLVADDTRDLSLSYDLRYAEDMVKVWANGFSITSPAGPGSATPKGLPLFYASHTYGNVGDLISGTFSNVENGAINDSLFDPNNVTTLAAGTARLQDLINLLKQAKDENGKFIRQVGVYKLYVSRIREVFWKAVLNNASKFSGQGANSSSLETSLK